jgi:hypothetical protein
MNITDAYKHEQEIIAWAEHQGQSKLQALAEYYEEKDEPRAQAVAHAKRTLRILGVEE